MLPHRRTYWETRFAQHAPLIQAQREQFSGWHHFLSWGMGVESSAIIAMWLLFPETRFWEDLTILTAQTGIEATWAAFEEKWNEAVHGKRQQALYE